MGGDVKGAIERASHALPDQGPIDVFIHHNTLHALEGRPFHDAVREAAERFGAEPYMSEDAYREALASGRIEDVDLDRALDEAEAILPRATFPAPGRVLARAVLLSPVHAITDAALAFRIEEESLLGRIAPDVPEPARRALLEEARLAGGEPRMVSALWERAEALARGRARRSSPPRPEPPIDERVRTVLVRLAAAFLDLGLSYWPMDRQGGFYRSASRAVRDAMLAPKWLRAAQALFEGYDRRGASAEDVVADCLAAASVPERERADYLTSLALALPGWAGMMRRLERQPPWGRSLPYEARLADFFAVRLVLDRAAAEVPRTSDAPAAARPPSVRADEAYRLFRLFQLLGVGPKALESARPEDAHALLDALDAFDGIARRRVWHEAYEGHHRRVVLSAIAKNRALELGVRVEPPAAQLLFCIDDREESLRRHLEEVRPDLATFGTLGFFGLPIAHRPLTAAHDEPLCPIASPPARLVVEVPAEDEGARRALVRRGMGRLLHAAHVSTRGLFRAALASVVFGVLALAPLVLRIVSPRLARAARSRAAAFTAPASVTRLRALAEPSDVAEAGLPLGFSPEEAAERIAGVLDEIALAALAPLVVVVGHGSTTTNNPHASAYDCGACGGHRGGANARAFAALANDPQVRAALAERGRPVSDETWFVSALHDTTTDEITVFDRDLVPASHEARLVELESALEIARRRDAFERCRRFLSFDPARGIDAALAHVEARAESLAEPRPECGHATNAVAVIGRRALTRGLFLDRRAFLCSYDPRSDEDGRLLERVLGGAAPVGAGISLEYYFSYVDGARFGAGTKLPHNVVGLLGVMNGHASDLRTGLPLQMVEIHEPVRLLVVVEAPVARLCAVLDRMPAVKGLAADGWIAVAAIDPEDGAISVMTPGGFAPMTPDPGELAVHRSSTDYHRGRRDHLRPVRIEPGRAA